MADPAKHVKEVFDIMGLDVDEIPLAMEALKHDSQQGLFGKRGNDQVSLTDEDIEPIDRMFADVGLPIKCKMSFEEFRSVIY